MANNRDYQPQVQAIIADINSLIRDVNEVEIRLTANFSSLNGQAFASSLNALNNKLTKARSALLNVQ